jgi:anti-sigma regulatory factor (Ser/Thr protein kinase)
MGPTESLRDLYPAAVESVPLARDAVVTFAATAGATPERLEAIRLAVSEAMTNAVMYAYGDDSGQIEVAATLASGELWVLIADDGCGLRADARSDGLGLGLALIALASDSFTVVRRPSGGIEVQLTFVLAPTVADRVDQPSSTRARISRT